MGLKSHFKRASVSEAPAEKIVLVERPEKETFYKTVFFVSLILGFFLGEFCEVKIGIGRHVVQVFHAGEK